MANAPLQVNTLPSCHRGYQLTRAAVRLTILIISPGQKHPWITPDSTSLLGELSPDTDSTDKHDGGRGSRARSTSQGARAFPASPLAPASSSRKEGADKQEMHTDYPSLRTASGKFTKVHYRPASLGNSYPYFSRLDTRLSCGNSTARTIQIPAREQLALPSGKRLPSRHRG